MTHRRPVFLRRVKTGIRAAADSLLVTSVLIVCILAALVIVITANSGACSP